jgi:hypothetical protein
MVVEKKTKEMITISFSAKVGTKGLKAIKELVEMIEAQSLMPSRKAINKLADDINKAAWEKLKKERGFNWTKKEL